MVLTCGGTAKNGQNPVLVIQILKALPNPSDLVPARHLAYCGISAGSLFSSYQLGNAGTETNAI